MSLNSWSTASGVQGVTGKAEEEVVAVFYGRRRFDGVPANPRSEAAGSWGVAYAAGRVLGAAQPARD